MHKKKQKKYRNPSPDTEILILREGNVMGYSHYALFWLKQAPCKVSGARLAIAELT